MAKKEPSPATLELINKYAKEKAVDIEELTLTLNSLVSMRAQLDLLYGLSRSLLTSEGGAGAMLSADSFVRSVSGLGDFSISELREVSEYIHRAYTRLLTIPYGRTEHEEDLLATKKEVAGEGPFAIRSATTGRILRTDGPRRGETAPEQLVGHTHTAVIYDEVAHAGYGNEAGGDRGVVRR
jgi:hypothetical protein